jgi:hypothetical protein
VSRELFLAAGTKELAPAEFAVVTTREAETLARLEQAEWLEVSPREAEELAGRPLAGAGGRFVLLRGLGYDNTYGAFSVSWQSGAVWVGYGCLGDRPMPVVRRAIVARLPDVPSEVYVTLHMAK